MARKKKNDSLPEFWFDDKEAQRAVDFFAECLTHTKGEWAGKPFALDPWQQTIIRDIFGWKRKDGTRKHRTVFIEIPRKAGKSTLAAGIALYLLFADREMGAEVYSAAADRDQAAIVFETAKAMLLKSDLLRNNGDAYKRSILYPKNGSVYRVLSADAHTKHGLNAHGIIFDELHAQPNRDLWDVLTTSTGARQQPLTVVITTAGYDRQSICYEVYDYACKVRDKIIEDDTFYPAIYEAKQDDDWTSVETWKKAHPGLGVSIKEDYMAAECAKARQMPTYENTFKRLLLNIWTEQDTCWIQREKWEACKGELPDFEGAACFAALDLSTTTDITALSLVFPVAGKFYVKPFFWVPEENIRQRVKRDRVPYDVWARQGFIEATDGNVVDYDLIRARINELGARYNIKEIAIDRWNATQISTQLSGDGFKVVAFGQGFASMSAPSKEFERLIVGRDFLHDGNPVLSWMASNVSVSQDPAGNIKPNKARSSEKIDGIVATIMAIGRAISENVDSKEDIDAYFSSGMRAI
jgi:phage terminase large subunit-like protein